MNKFKAFVKNVKRGMDARAKSADHFDKAGDPKNPNASKDLRRAVKYHNVVHKEEAVAEEVKDKYDEGEYDREGDMAKSDLRSIIANAQKLHDMMDDADNLPEWVQSKITLAEDYISTVANYMTSEMKESTGEICKSCQMDPCICDDSHGFVSEARMSAAVKLQRAFERQQQKSAASRKRGEELLNPPKKDEAPKTPMKNEGENKQIKGGDPCWSGYQMVGMKPGKGGRKVPNCVPANESVVPDRMKGKQKPYVSSDGKGGHEVLGNTGQVKATFSQKEHGKEAKSKAIAHLQKHYDTYMKEDLKADFKALRAMIEEASYKVDVEGLPTMYVQSDSPTEVKSNLRKILKKADMIRSVDRIPDAEVKKAFRLKAMGKDEE